MKSNFDGVKVLIFNAAYFIRTGKRAIKCSHLITFFDSSNISLARSWLASKCQELPLAYTKHASQVTLEAINNLLLENVK
ncbi:hypothetical protein T12_7575 [Trichinella patagoniensis]|uniref:Uncharacterized protein n=1 Tax=Trichinella patagoniensis TaxID=990121 RepID=A0A0V1A8M0_9BILA|nr:hypothetical protein T12_7575 [Trichinella patagoniensis]